MNEIGIVIPHQDFRGTIYFELSLILEDNLGLHSMLVLIESFVANFLCKVCKVPNYLLKLQLYEDKLLLRNRDSHDIDLNVKFQHLLELKKNVFIRY